jgi:hypothetical protein
MMQQSIVPWKKERKEGVWNNALKLFWEIIYNILNSLFKVKGILIPPNAFSPVVSYQGWHCSALIMPHDK